jgi:hypothetical protein
MDNKKYTFAFLITVAVFVVAIFASGFLNNKKLDEIRAVESQLALDILSSETQSALLEETACKDVNNNYLSGQLAELGEKLSYAASQNNVNNADIKNLKEYYSLLEIKDYLLMKKITAKCGIHPTFILYFYSNPDECEDCEKTGFVLDELRQKYPTIRVYSFDYNIDQIAVKTLTSIYHLNGALPALIINGDPYYGYQSLDELETTVPALRRLKAGISS